MNHKIKAIFVFLLFAFVLFIYCKTYSPVENTLAEYFILHSFRDTGATNAVAAVYLNYRVFDSLFETLMLMVSVVAVIHLSWRNSIEHE